MNQYLANGSVALVGAGPGDSGLFTQKGVRVLEQAEVVLVDRLVGEEILALIPPNAEIIDVGKQSGNHPVPQSQINRILLEKAQEGKRVVRLKGGDPYLFGRGAEELEEVVKAGIPFTVVPGISASIAVPAYAGIPVTHRNYASSLHIITGHAKAGSQPDIHYPSLVRLGGTLVFMMGFSAMEEILSGLLEAGLPPDTPAALIQEGTLPAQRKLVATAATLPEQARLAGMQPPAVLVVGEVCTLSEELDWFSQQPLVGETVLVTRPQSAGSALGDRLSALGCGVIRFPCIRLVPTADPSCLDRVSDYDWIVFTSAFGVQTFFSLLEKEQRDVRELTGIRFAAIGSRTAKEITSRGIRVAYMPGVYEAKHLAKGLCTQVETGERVLLFRASAGTPVLPAILQESGINCDDVPAYDTLYTNPAAEGVREKLLRGEINLVTFTSASTVEGFVRTVGEETIQKAQFTGVCIGEETAKAAQANSMDVVVSREATIESMVERILALREERGQR